MIEFFGIFWNYLKSIGNFETVIKLTRLSLHWPARIACCLFCRCKFWIFRNYFEIFRNYLNLFKSSNLTPSWSLKFLCCRISSKKRKPCSSGSKPHMPWRRMPLNARIIFRSRAFHVSRRYFLNKFEVFGIFWNY